MYVSVCVCVSVSVHVLCVSLYECVRDGGVSQ